VRLKKLSSVKNFQAEYTTLLEEKKTTYVDDLQARDEMKELRTIKSNVDRLLGNEERTKENVHGKTSVQHEQR